MKPLFVDEIKTLAQSLQPLVGARLQKVFSSDRDLVFEFYGQGQEKWLWIDLHVQCPMLTCLERKPRLPKMKKPISLFLHSHAVNRYLSGVFHAEEGGRVLRLQFGGSGVEIAQGDVREKESVCTIELRLFPHGQNVHVKIDKKSIWWKKPRDLAMVENEVEVYGGRSVDQLRQQWQDSRPEVFLAKGKLAHSVRNFSGEANSKTEVLDSEVAIAQRQKEVEKRRRTLVKIQTDMDAKRAIPWAKVGEWLKIHQQVEVPKDWAEYIDSKQSVAWNMERCFVKAKELKGKLQGSLARMTLLQQEIELLEKGEELLQISAPKVKGKNREAIKTRKHIIGGKWVAFVGKSARDNLNLLRKARAWDLWLHLRDYPGSHCIIHRQKNEVLTDSALVEGAQWVAKETFGRKSEHKLGEKLTVLVAECRHVNPIKGDKLGRVTFRNEKTFVVTFQP